MMKTVKVSLSLLICGVLGACQSGIGTPSSCLMQPESCQGNLPNNSVAPGLQSNASQTQNNSSNANRNTIQSNAAAQSPTSSESHSSNSGNLPLKAPVNLRILSQSTGSILLGWESQETSPHTYRLYLDNQLVKENIVLPNYTLTGLEEETQYTIALEAVGPEGVSSRVELQFPENNTSENSGSSGSGSSGSGSSGSGSSGSGSSGSGSSGSGSSGSGSSGSDDCPGGGLISLCLDLGLNL